jgi:hypothetical protein
MMPEIPEKPRGAPAGGVVRFLTLQRVNVTKH